MLITLLLCLPSVTAQVTADPTDAVDRVDWAEMLGRHDLRWDRLPQSWEQAPFLGNGEQGTMVRQVGPRTIRFDVGCSAAHDHRPAAADDMGEKHVEVLNRGRLFIGHMQLAVPVDIEGGTIDLRLFDAEAEGTLRSANGELRWKAVVHATEPVMYFESTASGDLEGATWSYVPEEARNPRAVRAKVPRTPANPVAVVEWIEPLKVKIASHSLHAGGQTTVAWREAISGPSTQLWLSVQHSFPDLGATRRAVESVHEASECDPEEWLTRHRDWWHAYYPASFVSTGSGYWDSFYWIQQYKLACATRDKGWIIDNQGPWLQPTAWNATWWNLNVQLAHSGTYQANRRGMASAMSHGLSVHRDQLALNVAEPYREDSYAIGRSASAWDLAGHAGEPGGREEMDRNIGRECGNLLWALHNVDLEVRYWKDDEMRDSVLLPLLTRAVNYYRHFLVEGEDGRLHLPITYSPEYRSAVDCTYDLDLLHWGVGRLLELAAEKSWTARDEPLMTAWTDLQSRLVAPHVNETGRMIGHKVALTGGHRHWSHLLAIYPLRTLTPNKPEDQELIARSLAHWQSFPRGIAGYSHTGASCMASILGDGDEALRSLERLKGHLRPNTLYSEIGIPVMETPLHGATAIQEMLLQSWGGRLRVFPAVPSSWPDAQFARMRGEGAFLVSALRSKGKTSWVIVESERGGVVEVDAQLAGVQWQLTGDATAEPVGESAPGVIRLSFSPGARALIWAAGEPCPEPAIEPIPCRSAPHRFGLPSSKTVETK